jgi:hypothetical protein
MEVPFMIIIECQDFIDHYTSLHISSTSIGYLLLVDPITLHKVVSFW